MWNSEYNEAMQVRRRRGIGRGGIMAIAMAAVVFSAMGYIYVSVKARQHALADASAEAEARMEDLRTEITVLEREKGELLAVAHLQRRLRDEGSDLEPIRPAQILLLSAPAVPVGAASEAGTASPSPERSRTALEQ